MKASDHSKVTPASILTRRSLLKSSVLLASAHWPTVSPIELCAARPPITVHDRLWLWSHVADSYSGKYNLPGRSRITPTEAAHYMGIPNVFMIQRDGLPQPPFDQYAVPFESLRELVWSVVSAGGEVSSEEQEAVLDLAFSNPKISGVVMDDFFVPKGKPGAMHLDQLRTLRTRLRNTRKELDLWVVLYERELERDITAYLDLCDIIQLWTWYGKNLQDLAKNFETAQRLAPGKRMALGLYWWDFGDKKPLPLSAMEQQCELGLEWLRAGRIEAMIFCGSWLCDRGLEPVAWTREWIQRVGSEKLDA